MPVEREKEQLLFTKEQIVNAKKYAQNKDLVSVLLLNSDFYTLEEVDKKIERFMKGKVN